eukprot:1160046-Pelagomonas_calceolata.AAC.9
MKPSQAQADACRCLLKMYVGRLGASKCSSLMRKVTFHGSKKGKSELRSRVSHPTAQINFTCCLIQN